VLGEELVTSQFLLVIGSKKSITLSFVLVVFSLGCFLSWEGEGWSTSGLKFSFVGEVHNVVYIVLFLSSEGFFFGNDGL